MNNSFKQIDGLYYIYVDDDVLLTPKKRKVTTPYRSIAERIVADLNKYGYNYHDVESILTWHFTTIDGLEPYGHEAAVEYLSDVFLKRPDWTFTERQDVEWKQVFGSWDNRSRQISVWLQNASFMQLSAVSTIANAYESINLGFELAKTMEKYPAGSEREDCFHRLASLVHEVLDFMNPSENFCNFKTFELYYGAQQEESLSITGDIKDDKETDTREKVVWRDKNGNVSCPGPTGCPSGCDDDCPIFHNSEGLELLRNGKPSEAIQQFCRAVSIAPDFHEFHNNLGVAYGATGQHQKAYESFTKALELKAEYPKAIHGLILSSANIGKLDEALQRCDEYERVTGTSVQDLKAQIKRHIQ